jgi:hypothetical protein
MQAGAAESKRRIIELNIEEIVLQGFSESDKEILDAAFRKELGQLISEGGLPEPISSGGYLRLDGGSFTVPRGQSAEQSGEHVAREIYARWSEGYRK